VKRALGLLVAAGVAGLAMTAMLMWRYDATSAKPDLRAYAASFDHPRTHAERLVDGMDGQAFGELAFFGRQPQDAVGCAVQGLRRPGRRPGRANTATSSTTDRRARRILPPGYHITRSERNISAGTRP